MKTCNKCEIEKDESEFNNNKSTPDKKCYQCRECDSKQSKLYYHKHREDRLVANKKYHSENPDIYRESRYRRRYGITLDEYEVLRGKQNGVCATCGNPEIMYKHLVVDHDHKTGVVRGLLCTNCNKALGNVFDNPDTLRNMIGYLAQFTASK